MDAVGHPRLGRNRPTETAEATAIAPLAWPEPSAATTTRPVTGLPASITREGIGGAQLAMTPKELGTVWDTPIRAVEVSTGCWSAEFRSNGIRGTAIFIDRRLGSLWFSRRGIATDRRIPVGSTRASVTAAYSLLEAVTDCCTPQASNLYHEPNGRGPSGLRFDVDRQDRSLRSPGGREHPHSRGLCRANET